MTQRIDAHHHLWRFDAGEYQWIDGSMSNLRRDYLPAELSDVLATANVHGTVAVQARQTQQETDWLLQFAEEERTPILGVVGWLPLTSPTIAEVLAEYGSKSHLKGLRHGVQDEPDGFLDRDDFNRGVRSLQGTGLRYDLLIRSRQFDEVTRFVDRHPDQIFILDHLGKPDIRGGEFAAWHRSISMLAERPHVACKLSGLVTEADPLHWTPQQLQSYVDTALQAFGTDRVMVGSDWPVLTVGCTYAAWWESVAGWIAELSEDEQSAIQGRNAIRWYNLDPQASVWGREKDACR